VKRGGACVWARENRKINADIFGINKIDKYDKSISISESDFV
jgi:hypothetical protein